MNSQDNSTLSMIHNAAKLEFLEKGYRSASLRNIVKKAGVTTGAFYGYYNSKEELFGALVGDAYEYALNKYKAALAEFAALPPEKQPDHMSKTTRKCMYETLLYMFDHRDEFHLILECSDGTKYASIIDELTELEVESTHAYYEVLKGLGRNVPYIDERLEHILVTGMINAYFEMLIHDMPLDDAKRYLEEMNIFYNAGWMRLMGQ